MLTAKQTIFFRKNVFLFLLQFSGAIKSGTKLFYLDLKGLKNKLINLTPI